MNGRAGAGISERRVRYSLKVVLIVAWILFLILSSLTAACRQLLDRELVPEEGRVLYGALQTRTDFIGANQITFHTISSSESTVEQLEVPVQNPLSSLPGVSNPPCPDWTQDGRYVAFNDGRNITVFDVREDSLREIEVDFDLLSTVVWSPDQTRLAYSGDSRVGPSNAVISTIWLADLRTKTWRRLVKCQYCVGPAWHPDGSLIAYANGDSDSIEIFDIRAGNISETFPVARSAFSTSNLGQGSLLAWSPQGDQIAFSAQHPDIDEQHVFVLTLETGEIDDLTPHEERADSPTWSPSGEQILYRTVRSHEPPLPSEEPWLLDTSFVIRSLYEPGDQNLLSAQTSPILTCPNWLSPESDRESSGRQPT